MKYSVCLEAVFMGKETSFTENMRLIRECGYHAYEFWAWWNKDLDAVAETQKELDLKCAAFCTGLMYNPGDAAQHGSYLQSLWESIQVAHRLECPTIISQAGFQAEGIPYAQHRKNLTKLMREAARMCAEEGITLALEPLNLLVDHPGYHLWSSKDAFDLVDIVDSKGLKILFDIYHQQVTEGNLLNNILDNIDKIAHFHAAGNPGRGEITKGEICYKNIFAAIQETGYQGYAGLEYTTPDDPLPGLKRAQTVLV